jgi:hypothetical protein
MKLKLLTNRANINKQTTLVTTIDFYLVFSDLDVVPHFPCFVLPNVHDSDLTILLD